MTFDPDIHHRRSIRLRNYDYRNSGAYFVTICTFQRECLFGVVMDGEMRMNESGMLAHACWQGIPEHFPEVELDVYVIMPNHIHGILVMHDRSRARHTLPDSLVLTRNNVNQARATHASPLRRSVGAIVGSFKSAVTKQMNEGRDNPGSTVWQRNFYEHIIRNDEELAKSRRYITENPSKWRMDESNPANMIS